jgi:hypothetical protein
MLTERGWEVFDTLVRSGRAFEKECARVLGPEKWQELRHLLEELSGWCESYTAQSEEPGAVKR